jgi:ABC-2 type transport system permease protein
VEVYLAAYKFNLLKEFAYPIEILAFAGRKLITLGFLILFWFVIAKTNPDIFTFKQILSYFLVSGAVSDLSFTTWSRFGRTIQQEIKNGTLSNQLIRPVNTLKFLYVSYMGGKTSVTIYAIISLVLGLCITKPASVWGAVLFPISLVLTALAGFGLNVYIGLLGFYSPEASSIKNTIEHIKKLLSGSLIPLSYFPPVTKTIAELTPFPALVYYPTVILQNGDLNKDTLVKLGMSLFWAILLVTSSKFFWKRALKNYDGVGI